LRETSKDKNWAGGGKKKDKERPTELMRGKTREIRELKGKKSGKKRDKDSTTKTEIFRSVRGNGGSRLGAGN